MNEIWYLAGPMTGIPDSNYPAFEAAAQTLRAAGYTVVSPHDQPMPDDKWHQALRQDLRTLTQCDGIILMPGWNRSRGARLELTVALSLDMPVKLFSEARLIDCAVGASCSV